MNIATNHQKIKLIDIDLYLKILGHKGRAMYLRKNLEAI